MSKLFLTRDRVTIRTRPDFIDGNRKVLRRIYKRDTVRPSPLPKGYQAYDFMCGTIYKIDQSDPERLPLIGVRLDNGSFIDIDAACLQPHLPKGDNQGRRLMSYLQQGYSITIRSAMMDFGIYALSKRISELRAQGFPIVAEREKNPATGQRYHRYSLYGAATLLPFYAEKQDAA